MTDQEPKDTILRGIEQITSLEDLYKTVRIITIRGWVAIIFIALFAISSMTWSFLGKLPITISGKCVVVQDQSSQELTIFGFVPLFGSEEIHPGMKAMVTLDSINSSIYGIMKATVLEISRYPVDPLAPQLDSIPSMPLKEYLTQGKAPVTLLIIKPIVDPKTDQIQWTSKKTPPTPISDGNVGMVQVILNVIKPISYVIPEV